MKNFIIEFKYYITKKIKDKIKIKLKFIIVKLYLLKYYNLII